MVPIDGEIREGVGLLGSPSFEIPRSVQRDSTFDGLKSGEKLRSRLAAKKNKHNAATMGLFLLVGWIHLFGVTLLLSGAGGPLRLVWCVGDRTGPLRPRTSVHCRAYFVLVERAVTVLHPLGPLFCSIYDLRFWRRGALLEGAVGGHILRVFNGTPFKNVIWRLLGVQLGRRVFDDGCMLD